MGHKPILAPVESYCVSGLCRNKLCRREMNQLARLPKQLGHAIKLARMRKGLTQRELASMSGVWQETISKVENGLGGAKIDTIFSLLAALDLELSVTERSKVNWQDLGDIW